MKLQDTIRAALEARQVAYTRTMAADTSYELSMESLKKRFNEKEVTGSFYDMERARLASAHEQARAAALEPLEKIREEYQEAVQAWGTPSGDALDMNTVWILQNMDLTAEQYNRLLDENKSNYTMYTVIRKVAEGKRAAVADANTGRPLNQQIPFDLAEPIQSPEARVREFDNFIFGLTVSLGKHANLAVDPSVPNGAQYQSMEDKVKAIAARTLDRIQPMEDGESYTPEEFAYKVVEPERPSVW